MKSLLAVSSRPLVAGFVLAAFALPATRLAAVEGVSNLAGAADTGVAFVDNLGSGLWQAASFLTGPVGVTLDSLDLSLFHAPSASEGFTVSLAADPDGISGGTPGTVLTTLVGPQPSSLQIYNYTDPADTLLAPNTPYWIIASVPEAAADSLFGWERTSSTAETGLAGWSIIDGYSITLDSGASWSQLFLTEGGTPLFRVNVSAASQVPEPSTYAAGGALVLMVGAAWLRRRQQRQAS